MSICGININGFRSIKPFTKQRGWGMPREGMDAMRHSINSSEAYCSGTVMIRIQGKEMGHAFSCTFVNKLKVIQLTWKYRSLEC